MTMRDDLCRGTGLALGAALALALVVALTGPLGLAGALVLALLAAAALVLGLMRFITPGADRPAPAPASPLAGAAPMTSAAHVTRELVAPVHSPATGPVAGPSAGPVPAAAPVAAPVPEIAEAQPAPGGIASGETGSDGKMDAPAGDTTAGDAPAGAADDLTRLKGVGPKLAEALQEAGITRFAQIAAWTEADVAWAEENVKGAKGRIGRDGWIAQAREMSAGTAG